MKNGNNSFGGYMKRKSAKKIKAILLILCFGTSVFTAGYFYLDSILNKTSVSENVNDVPYYSPTPENATVLFEICEDKILFNLDFNEETVNIVFGEVENHGYNINYTVECDYETVGYFADLIGGIELNSTRYTGAHITEMLEYSYVSAENKRLITESIVNGLAKTGITKEDLLYLIENTNTDLKLNECYFWVGYIDELCKSPRFVN